MPPPFPLQPDKTTTIDTIPKNNIHRFDKDEHLIFVSFFYGRYEVNMAKNDSPADNGAGPLSHHARLT